MAITRKPKLSAPMEGTSVVDVDALINRGGSVARAEKVEQTSSSKPVPVVLRLPSDVLARVDQVVEARRVRVPRHTWLMEAVIEKLEREAF